MYIYIFFLICIYICFFFKENKETKQEKVKSTLQHLLRINKYSLGQKDTAETRQKTKKQRCRERSLYLIKF